VIDENIALCLYRAALQLILNICIVL